MAKEPEKLKIALPVIVEGKYDKIRLSSVIDADIFTTGGFALFRNDEQLAMIRQLAKNGLIVLTDSDGAGGLIRSHISSAVSKDKLYQLYIPTVKGKEKRKKAPSAEGTLGVEGMDNDTLRRLFLPFASGEKPTRGGITKVDLFSLGLSGGNDASKRRALICRAFGLPEKISPNAMLSALNILTDKDTLWEKAEHLFAAEGETDVQTDKAPSVTVTEKEV